MSATAAAISRGELLLTYIEGLEPYLNHQDVSEIMIVPEDSNWNRYLVFIEENGVMREVTSEVELPIRESDLLALGRGLARNSLRRELNQENPKLSATLENGSRIAITIPPASDGILVTIRNYRERPFTVEELIERGTLTRKAAQVAQEAIERRRNILISGGNGTGKSTLLNTLAGAYIPRDRRVIVLEDAARDIKLPDHRNKGFVALRGPCLYDGDAHGSIASQDRPRDSGRSARRRRLRFVGGAQHRTQRQSGNHSRRCGPDGRGNRAIDAGSFNDLRDDGGHQTQLPIDSHDDGELHSFRHARRAGLTYRSTADGNFCQSHRLRCND